MSYGVDVLVQARMSSSRLPGKVMMKLGDKTVVENVVERVKRSKHAKNVTVLTSTHHSDDPLVDLLNELGIKNARGPLDDVLGRFLRYSETCGASTLVRVTADCPVIDPDILDQTIELHFLEEADYTSNTLKRSYPRGLDVEVFSVEVLRALGSNSDLSEFEKEHVTYAMYSRPLGLKLASLVSPIDLSMHRWTLDTIEDFDFLQKIFREMPRDGNWGETEILELLKMKPDLVHLED
jgi:spore coat polysaccharide biosynthesis protein SpsF